MSLRTVCFGGLAVTKADACAAEILGCRNKFQVLRVDTATVATQMIQLESDKQRADELLVGPTVCVTDASLLAELAVELSVSVGTNESRPFPTA